MACLKVISTKNRPVFITTSIDKYWPSDCKPFLAGEWCLPQDIDELPSAFDGTILPYRWDNHDQLHEDLAALNIIYESILFELVNVLNEHHKVEHENRYWRIIIGPWLYTFIHTLYFKWTVCDAANELQASMTTIFANINAASYIPRDFADVDHDDLYWQHLLFMETIKAQNKIEWFFDKSTPLKYKRRDRKINFFQALKHRLIQELSGLFVKPQEAFLTSTYLGLVKDALIQIRLGQIPRMWKPPELPFTNPDLSLRNDLASSFNCSSSNTDKFIKFVKEMSIKYIPTAYLEGYKKNLDFIEKFKWPKKPLVIFTSNAFQFNEAFKIWAAAKSEEGSRLVIGQHGGFYGVGKFVAGEKHQIKISDRFLTWGWESQNKRVKPAFNFQNPNHRRLRWNPRGGLLLLTVPIRRSVYKLSSWPNGAKQSRELLEDQLNFAELIGSNIRKKLTCRLYTQIDERMRTKYCEGWQRRYPEVKIDHSEQSIDKAIKTCRLFVYTYNSTGFIESLTGNVPTIFFWRPDRWRLREDAENMFEELTRVGIFHQSPESAAQHVTRVWNDVSVWWNSNDVQAARLKFCESYGRKSDQPVEAIHDLLKTVR